MISAAQMSKQRLERLSDLQQVTQCVLMPGTAWPLCMLGPEEQSGVWQRQAARGHLSAGGLGRNGGVRKRRGRLNQQGREGLIGIHQTEEEGREGRTSKCRSSKGKEQSTHVQVCDSVCSGRRGPRFSSSLQILIKPLEDNLSWGRRRTMDSVLCVGVGVGG